MQISPTEEIPAGFSASAIDHLIAWLAHLWRSLYASIGTR
jgi:hypothetical protein